MVTSWGGGDRWIPGLPGQPASLAKSRTPGDPVRDSVSKTRVDDSKEGHQRLAAGLHTHMCTNRYNLERLKLKDCSEVEASLHQILSSMSSWATLSQKNVFFFLFFSVKYFLKSTE